MAKLGHLEGGRIRGELTFPDHGPKPGGILLPFCQASAARTFASTVQVILRSQHSETPSGAIAIEGCMGRAWSPEGVALVQTA